MNEELRMVVEQVTEKEVTKKDDKDRIVKKKQWTSKLDAFNPNTGTITTLTMVEDSNNSTFTIGDEWSLKKGTAQKKLGKANDETPDYDETFPEHEKKGGKK